MWAEVISIQTAKLMGLYKSKAKPHPLETQDFIKQIGLLDYIGYIRKLQLDDKLPIWAETNYPVFSSIDLSM